MLLTTDEKGTDEKLIAVPSKEVDPNYNDINDYNELGPFMNKRILHFFKHYKDIDENKWVKIEGFKDAKEAYAVYLSAHANMLKSFR